MIYYRVIHFFITKEPEHLHRFDIGIYDNKKKAVKAVKRLRKQEGFRLRPNNFYIIPVIRIVKPRLLNITYWNDGFFTYTHKKESLSKWVKFSGRNIFKDECLQETDYMPADELETNLYKLSKNNVVYFISASYDC